MSMFNNVKKEAMVKYMDAFIELANLVLDIEKTDIAALHNLSMYIKDDCDLAPEVADGYRAVYNRVHDMIFTDGTKQTPYTTPTKGVYQHRVDYKSLNKDTSNSDDVLCSMVFDTYKEAENFCFVLIDHISKYDSITVTDVVIKYMEARDSVDYTTSTYDYRRGWTNLPRKGDDMIVRDEGMWKVVLPKPAALPVKED